MPDDGEGEKATEIESHTPNDQRMQSQQQFFRQQEFVADQIALYHGSIDNKSYKVRR